LVTYSAARILEYRQIQDVFLSPLALRACIIVTALVCPRQQSEQYQGHPCTMPSTKNHPAQFADFIHFHRMLCKPATAQRCLDAFDGSIVFMPNGTSRSLRIYEYPSGLLALIFYYALVLCSLTGLFTLLQRTQILIECEENHVPVHEALRAEVAGKSNGVELMVETSRLLKHYNDLYPDTTSLFVKRRFEYNFGGLITVVMLHLTCNQGRLHLLEIYHINSSPLRCISNFIALCLGNLHQMIFQMKKKRS